MNERKENDIRPIPRPVNVFFKTPKEIIAMEEALEAAGVHGEDKTIAIYDACVKMGIIEKPPCER